MEPMAAQRSSAPAKCTNCSHDLQSPAVCEHCHAVCPVDGVNFYELLGIAVSYDVDPAEVQAKYLNLARAVHPDRLRAQTREVEQLSLRTTAQLNRARGVLLDPVLRAEYLLGMAGGPSPAEDRRVPQEVLMETLMLREELEEARAAGDEAGLAAARRQVRQRHDETLGRVAGLCRQLPGDEAARSALRAAINAIRYYQKMLEQA